MDEIMGANSMRKYIALKDDKIVKVFMTSTGYADIVKSCQYKKLDYDDIQETPVDAEVHTKMHKGEFKKGWKLKTLEERIAGGYISIPEHLKVIGDEVREKTVKEKIDAGLITLEAYQYYDTKEKCIKVDESKLPAPKEPTQAELLQELHGLLDRAKVLEEQIKK
jgi:hypothetical protein